MWTASFRTPGLSLSDPRCVSIARTAPRNYHGRVYRKLCPTRKLLSAWRAGQLTPEQYAAEYEATVLYWAHANEVVEELGNDAILFCWEPAGAFCHRRLAAHWLETELGIVVPEWAGE